MADNSQTMDFDSLAKQALVLPLPDATPIYEKLVSSFPTAAKYWTQYVEAYMAINNDEATKQIFSRCLLDCPHIQLWRCYIKFIKKLNENKGPQGQEEIQKAYEFMLNYIGTDMYSGPVWMEYIAFLKQLQISTGMMLVRKAYQTAILIPTHHVEQLWREYEKFENSVSPVLAKGILLAYQPKFNSARSVYRERKKYVDDINWTMLAVPPTGSDREEKQYVAWKRLIAFEKGNPQHIESESCNRRIVFTYEQALMYLYHYPYMWYEYATWQAKIGSVDTAIKVFKRGLKAVPDSEVLWYAYAEVEEGRGEIQSAKKIYESLLGKGDAVSPLTHIQFLRFLRRTEGTEAARKYFIDIYKTPNCTYQIFVAYAEMAFCLEKDTEYAQKVFDVGMKRFVREPKYIFEYVDFLCRLNDENNVRALFERALGVLAPEESVDVWDRFVKFERTYGDLASMLKVEQRRKEAFSQTSEEGSLSEASLRDVMSRYSFKDLCPCSSKGLEHLERQEWLMKNHDKESEKPTSLDSLVRDASKLMANSNPSAAVIHPNQATGTNGSLHDILKLLPPVLVKFVTQLPVVEGASTDVDTALSILLQGNISAGSASNLFNSSESAFKTTRGSYLGKRKEMDDVSSAVQSRPAPRDAFMIRQLQKARVATSQTGSTASGGSVISGGLSGSSG